MPMTFGNQQKLKKRQEESPLEPPEVTKTANSLILGFSAPELWENKSLVFKATQFVAICYSSPRNLI